MFIFKGDLTDKKLLDIYSDYLIAQNQYATATGLSALLDGEISHDQITRFLKGINNFEDKAVQKIIKKILEKIYINRSLLQARIYKTKNFLESFRSQIQITHKSQPNGISRIK